MKIDWDKPLYDSDGYKHTLIAKGGVQSVTRFSFCYVVWDTRTGRCLISGAESLTVSNNPLCTEESSK